MKKNLKLVVFAFFCVLGLLLPIGSKADVQVQARDLMIEKLSKVLLTLPESDSARAGVVLRLADLYSERARQSLKLELALQTVNSAYSQDRQQALRYYKEALPTLTGDSRSKVLLQMGHLQQMSQNENEALKIYQQILSAKDTSASAKSDAHLATAEVYYQKKNWTEAKKFFEMCLAEASTVSKGYASYRLAWSHFYSGAITNAIATLEKVLSTPAWLTRTAQAVAVEPDLQFQEELTRDLITFYVQTPQAASKVESIYNWTPEKAQLNHLFYMGTELERLGQKKQSLVVYQFLLQKENRPQFKLETLVRLAQLQMELKETESSLGSYEKALLIWPETCQTKTDVDLQCKEISSRLKNYIIDWHKLEKESPSEDLMRAYALYFKAFQDPDMYMQAALAARRRKDFTSSNLWYQQSAHYFSVKAKENAQSEVDTKLDIVLLALVENAELTKNQDELKSSLERYLAMSSKKEKVIDVEYRLAKIDYDSSNYEAASEKFSRVAQSTAKGQDKLKLTAAELALDALALQKKNSDLQQKAIQFANLFPEQKNNFLQVSAKASLNLAAQLAETSSDQALVALSVINKNTLTATDQILLIKNKIILNEKKQNWSEARLLVDELLSLPNLTIADRDFAYEHKAQLAELSLDFKTAYKALSSLSPKSSNYRLALLAELANENPTLYLQAELEKATDSQEKINLASQIILLSNKPENLWVKNKKYFDSNKEAYANLAKNIYSKNKSPSFLKTIKSQVDLKSTAGYRVIVREELFANYEKLNALLKAHELKTKSDHLLATSLKERNKFLLQADQLAQEAIQLSDFTSQLLTLDLVAREEKRFYNDLIGLPLPQGLQPQEEVQYMQALSEQAAPHRIKSDDVTTKLNQLKGDNKVYTELAENYKSADQNDRRLLEKELQLIVSLSIPQSEPHLSTALASTTKVTTSITGIESARNDLRNDPMNKVKVQNLLDLEKQAGRNSMVTYLQERIKKIDTEGIK